MVNACSNHVKMPRKSGIGEMHLNRIKATYRPAAKIRLNGEKLITFLPQVWNKTRMLLAGKSSQRN